MTLVAQKRGGKPERLVPGTKRFSATTRQNIGRQLSLLRQRLGMSRAELAFLLKLPCGMISRIEAGKLNPDDDCFQKVVRYFAFEWEFTAEAPSLSEDEHGLATPSH